MKIIQIIKQNSNPFCIQRLFSRYTKPEIVQYSGVFSKTFRYIGKRRKRSREAVKVKSKRSKIRKRETLLLNQSIPSTEEYPSTSSINQETPAAVGEDVAGNIYIILVLIRKRTSLSFWTSCIIIHMPFCCSGFLVYLFIQDSRTGNTFLSQLKVFNVRNLGE